jgi:hypothetical protein
VPGSKVVEKAEAKSVGIVKIAPKADQGEKACLRYPGVKKKEITKKARTKYFRYFRTASTFSGILLFRWKTLCPKKTQAILESAKRAHIAAEVPADERADENEDHRREQSDPNRVARFTREQTLNENFDPIKGRGKKPWQ